MPPDGLRDPDEGVDLDFNGQDVHVTGFQVTFYLKNEAAILRMNVVPHDLSYAAWCARSVGGLTIKFKDRPTMDTVELRKCSITMYTFRPEANEYDIMIHTPEIRT